MGARGVALGSQKYEHAHNKSNNWAPTEQIRKAFAKSMLKQKQRGANKYVKQNKRDKDKCVNKRRVEIGAESGDSVALADRLFIK